MKPYFVNLNTDSHWKLQDKLAHQILFLFANDKQALFHLLN